MNRTIGGVLAVVLAAPLAFADDVQLEALRQFLAVAPAARLQSALAENDQRVLGVMGYVLETPGVAGPTARERIRIIPGTSDAIMSDEHGELNRRARRYAEEYNTELLRRTEKGTPHNSRLQRPAAGGLREAPEAAEAQTTNAAAAEPPRR